MPYRLGILGTFVWDTVWTLADQAAGRPFESWGGMAFSLAAGAAALPPRWEIVPIAHVGSDLIDRAHGFLDTLGIGSRGGIVAVDEPNNRVELRYTDASSRGETMSGGVRGWTWAELEPHVRGVDALYVNFFSGWEIDLPTARKLRTLGRRGMPLYADLHSLFLGPPGAGPRPYRKLPRWREWLSCFNAVQVNEDEYELLFGRRLDADLPTRLVNEGASAAFVTLGHEGAAYAAELQHVDQGDGTVVGREIQSGRVPVREPVVGGDPTGCGDVWGITAFTSLLGGLEPHDAVTRANRLAAAKMRHRGATGLYEHLRRSQAQWELSEILR